MYLLNVFHYFQLHVHLTENMQINLAKVIEKQVCHHSSRPVLYVLLKSYGCKEDGIIRRLFKTDKCVLKYNSNNNLIL